MVNLYVIEQAVIFPTLGICINIIPNLPIFFVIPYDVVVE